MPEKKTQKLNKKSLKKSSFEDLLSVLLFRLNLNKVVYFIQNY